MYDEGIRQQIETMPKNFRVVSRWRHIRIVDQFEPVHAAITDDGSGTEAGVNERVACEGRTVAPMRSKGSRTTPCVIRLERLLDRPDAGPSLLDARPGELSGLRSGCPADASVDPSPAPRPKACDRAPGFGRDSRDGRSPFWADGIPSLRDSTDGCSPVWADGIPWLPPTGSPRCRAWRR